MTELVAKVCNEATIVTTVIEDLSPLTVRTEITKIAFASSLNTRTESMKQSIFREIKDVLIEELLCDPNRNVGEALTDILRGDAEFAGELVRKFEDEIGHELKKARSKLCGNRTTQNPFETSERSKDQAVTNLPEFYPPCPAGSSPLGHLIKEHNGKRYLIAGRGLIQL